MAMDETMLILKDREEIPNTLRLYVFKPSAVTIGYFQKIEETVDLEFIRSRGIPVIRRITGGGAVYHDEQGEVTYSVVVSSDDIPRDIKKSYEKICLGIVKALEYLGLRGQFVPINDVVVNRKKISGSAQIRRGRAVLQHGTLMYNTDLRTLAMVLRVPREKLASHGISSIEERVTTVSRELKRKVYRNEVIKALIRGFGEVLQAEFFEEGHSSEEMKLARELVEKYVSPQWNFRR